MADPSEGAELTLTSGEGECERHVCDTEGEPGCHVAEPMGDVCLARLRTRPQPLNMETLQGVRDGLEQRGELGKELGSCLDLALERFCQEPQYVQENARLLICWDGGELEFIAGQGQCEISVSSSAGEPQYHITEKTWDVFVDWMNSNPEPLSIKNLEQVQKTLERWGALEHWGGLGMELSGCFVEVISQFSQEPPCVQENARMGIQWDGGSLEFLSGEGECEISMRYRDGKPWYDIGELPMHMYLARLRAHPEPLSADTLRRVRDKLGSCKGDSDELRACFDCAWEGFSREPQYVQENARLLIHWDGEQVKFTSGKGECEISVNYRDGKAQYHVVKVPVHVYVAQLRTHQQSLSADTLQRVLSELGPCRGDNGTLKACFDRAWQGFRREPPCVQENARLLIQWGGGELEFVSGQGQCEISVLHADGEPQYHVKKLGRDMPVTWSHASPEPLSIKDLVRVRNRLGHWGALGEELSGCFAEAISQFRREPPFVQGSARMRIQWDRGSLEFLSGEGQYEISVSYQEGNPRYHFHVETLPGHLYVSRLRFHKNPLSADNLVKFRTELGLCQGDTAVLRASLLTAWEGFSREPQCVQENARLLIQWGGGELEFVSGQGQCKISVLLADGEPQYHITELGGDRPVTWSHSSPEPLSVAALARVRNRLGCWGALGGKLRGCFEKAISQFSREPPCVQENARLRICWDRGSLELLAGEGQCEISVCYRDGRPQYDIEKLPVDMYLARLHKHPEPLSTDTLRRAWSKLGSCKEEKDNLRACFHHAWEGFSQESPAVQANARLLIQCNGRQVKFTSGKGECEITVSYGDGKPQYRVVKIPVHMYLAQLRARQQSLSADTLQRVLSELGSCHGDTDALRACFDRAWEGFSREPRCVQENARLLIRWGRKKLEFVSGRGENLITVCKGAEGRIQYMVQVSGWWSWIARLLISFIALGRD